MPSRIMEGTKLQIFEAALDLFAKSSYHTVSMRDIAKAVGIKTSSIYNHFESKDALLTAIYNYYDEQIIALTPDLNALIAAVGKEHPHDVLRKTAFVYPPEILQAMARALSVVSTLVRTDPRADDLIYRNLIHLPYYFDPPLLNRMIELDEIEPLDIDSYTLLHSTFNHSAAVRFFSDRTIPDKEWMAGLEMIYHIVQPRHRPDHYTKRE